MERDRSRSQAAGQRKMGTPKRKPDPSSRGRVLIGPEAAKRGLVLASARATTSALTAGKMVAVASPTKATPAVEASRPQLKPRRNRAGLPSGKRRGSAGRSARTFSGTPSPPKKLLQQLAPESSAADSGSAALRSPSDPPTPGSVRSSWSSFASRKSPRGEEPSKRFEVSLRGGGEANLGAAQGVRRRPSGDSGRRR